MQTPGRIEINTTLQLKITFTDQDDALTNPTTVTFRLHSPSGVETSYVYGTDAEMERESTGLYLVSVTPDESGRWFFRWQTTGPVYATAGNFIVQSSPFYDDLDVGYQL